MPALDRDKLVKMLGMLGSCHDGEVAAAGRSAHTLLKDAGTTWSEVLTPPDGASPSDRNKLAEAEAENRRLVIELAQRQLDIDNLIAEHQQEIRELQGAQEPRKNSRISLNKNCDRLGDDGIRTKNRGRLGSDGIRSMVYRDDDLGHAKGAGNPGPSRRISRPPPEPRPGSLTVRTQRYSSSLRWISERVQGWSRALGLPAQHSTTPKTPTRTGIER